MEKMKFTKQSEFDEDSNLFVENKLESQIGQETILTPPVDTYFIHGVKSWSKNNQIGIGYLEISASLQKDNFTKPLRPYGYVLRVEKGAISKAFDTDTTSEYDENCEKKFKLQSMEKKFREYNENELEELISNTKSGSHNEIWIKGDKAEIIGAYIVKDDSNSPGANAFIKECQRKNILVKSI